MAELTVAAAQRRRAAHARASAAVAAGSRDHDGVTDAAAPTARPAGRRGPVSTYRLQLQPDFTFDDAAEQVDYLAALGVSHLYLSPVLQARPGRRTATTSSTTPGHRGGRRRRGVRPARRRRCRAAGLGVVVDVVPNHMTTPDAGLAQRAAVVAAARRPASRPTPRGSTSTGTPRTAGSSCRCSARRSRRCSQPASSRSTAVATTATSRSLRYYDHVFPVAPGTETAAAGASSSTPSTTAWRLARGGRRAQLPALLRRHLAHRGAGRGPRGLRRHPRAAPRRRPGRRRSTGSASTTPTASPTPTATSRGWPTRPATPGWSSRRSSRATSSCPTLAQRRHDRLRRAAARRQALRRPGRRAAARPTCWPSCSASARTSTRSSPSRSGWSSTQVRLAEVNRLMRLVGRVRGRTSTRPPLRRALEALLVAHGPLPRLRRARASAAEPEQAGGARRRPQRARALARAERTTTRSARGRASSASAATCRRRTSTPRPPSDEFVVRFQQTCGPVMAKGIEDTAFYRYVRLVGLNEVGGDPDPRRRRGRRSSTTSRERLLATLADHDDDAVDPRHQALRGRARPALRARRASRTSGRRWVDAGARAGRAAPRADGSTRDRVPPVADRGRRLADQRASGCRATPSRRFARRSSHTTWTEPDEAYEAAVRARSSTALTGDAARRARTCEAWVDATAEPARAARARPEAGAADRCPACRTSTRAPSSSTSPSSTPTTAAWSTTPSDAAGSRGSTAAQSPADLNDEKLLVTSRRCGCAASSPSGSSGEDARLPPVATHERARGCLRPRRRQRRAGRRCRHPAGGRPVTAAGAGAPTVALPEGRWRDVLTGGTVVSPDHRRGPCWPIADATCRSPCSSAMST